MLVDGAAYYPAVAAAARRARRAIRILAWDLHTKLRLHPERQPGPFPDTLGDFLLALADARPELRIHILCWGGNLIYKAERQDEQEVRRFFAGHPRVHFRFSHLHPPAASNHEKLVVIDDKVAFLGGLDLTRDRWDTSEHRARNPDRKNPLGELYRPFHDVHMAVDGGTAAVLGGFFIDRWREATGERLSPVRAAGDPWPTSLAPDFRDVELALSRTRAALGSGRTQTEIRELYRDAIRTADRYVYVECEYLTSEMMVDCLAARLRSPRGPEVVIVGPLRCTGWIEETAMGSLRTQCLLRLREADRYRRLRLYYPTVPDIGDDFVAVHSKLLIADGRLLHLGTANLSNRSLGIDSELDFTLEARGREDVAAGIAEVLSRLLGEHLGVEPPRVRHRLAETGSLLATVESLRGGPRTLMPLEAASNGITWARSMVPEVVDPHYPLSWQALTTVERGKTDMPAWRKGIWPLAALLLVAAMAGLWRWTPLREWTHLDTLRGLVGSLEGSPWLPAAVVGAFLAGGLVMFPVIALIGLTALLVPAPWNFFLALAGSLASALLLYGLGRVTSPRLLRRIAGDRLELMRRKLDRYGVVAITVLRLVPLAPFSVFNLVCGGMRIRLFDYVLGTLLGMLPGTILMTVLGAAAESALRRPSSGSTILLAAIAAAAVGLALWLGRLGARSKHAR